MDVENKKRLKRDGVGFKIYQYSSPVFKILFFYLQNRKS
jgi:hypothetical protein